jgi:Restriction endonuclease EcoRV
VVEPKVQNHYPDFTLMRDATDKSKIAVDVKTTYRGANGRFGFTLAGYTSFMRVGNDGQATEKPLGCERILTATSNNSVF